MIANDSRTFVLTNGGAAWKYDLTRNVSNGKYVSTFLSPREKGVVTLFVVPPEQVEIVKNFIETLNGGG